jgi:hypothetical protein
MAVGIRIDRGRANAHLGAGTNDVHRDLTAIGDQDLTKHDRVSGVAM